MKTTVEWLSKELESYGDSQFCKIEWEQLDSLIQQANKKIMTKEQAKTELIDLLYNQVVDLTMMSKIELGDDVIEEIRRLNNIINKIKP